ncbi:SRPBCC family protein [Neolewinella persica]|uniref:SRPBCC family protein n=1 Tax=Neolewinella persica TaxID=70998 RepID=UPI00036C58E2|nr:SRPBCC domain-containing protein [Neolewinella persica]
MNDQSTGHHIYHDLVIKADPAAVFAAISEPAHLVNWWPLRCTGQPMLGNEYNFHFTSEYDWFGEVSQLIPKKSFHIKMTRADEDWTPTTFGFNLMPADGGTQLEFSHLDWPACNAHFRRSSFCWAMLLKGLKDYVEKGIVLPFEERA